MTRFHRAVLPFQSTLPSRGETSRLTGGFSVSRISIHSPLTGRDAEDWPDNRRRCPISIHSPLTGRDLDIWGQRRLREDFNPLSPHGERRTCACGNANVFNFNPLSPHGERQKGEPKKLKRQRFQSTLPSRGET